MNGSLEFAFTGPRVVERAVQKVAKTLQWRGAVTFAVRDSSSWTLEFVDDDALVVTRGILTHEGRTWTAKIRGTR